MGRAYVVGTFDTKGEELSFLRERLNSAGIATRLVDVGTRSHERDVDIPAQEVAKHHPEGPEAVYGAADRGQAISAMIEAFRRFVSTRDDIDGMLGIGGGGGTALICPGLRALPIGIPKIMLSTLACGDVAPYVGQSDLCMLHSVTDIAGLNRISRLVLANAAHALAGMIRFARESVQAGATAEGLLPAVALSMFGVTTPCVERVRRRLEPNYDCLVFHATGSGGRTLESLVESGLVVGVLDVTTTEIADELCGGILSAGEERLDSLARRSLPWVGSLGALDMVNFGGRESVPERYADRLLHVHNPQVTLMRTTPEECARIGSFLADKLNHAMGPVRLLVPDRGLSALDAEGQAFWDPEADAALFETLAREFRGDAHHQLVRLPMHINEPAFADELVRHFLEL